MEPANQCCSHKIHVVIELSNERSGIPNAAFARNGQMNKQNCQTENLQTVLLNKQLCKPSTGQHFEKYFVGISFNVYFESVVLE